METIVESDDLRITFEPGTGAGDELVLSFTGANHSLGGMQKEEFLHSLRRPSLVRDAYFITDKSRSWYNVTADLIVRSLKDRVAGKSFYTLGNSMGGFGALLFANLFGSCQGSVSFSPQYSVSAELAPFESRWADLVTAIRDWRHPTCIPAESLMRRPQYVFCGARSQDDVRHAELIRSHASDRTTVFVIADCDHLVVRELKTRGGLHDLLDTVFSAGGSREMIETILTRCGFEFSVWPQTSNVGARVE